MALGIRFKEEAERLPACFLCVRYETVIEISGTLEYPKSAPIGRPGRPGSDSKTPRPARLTLTSDPYLSPPPTAHDTTKASCFPEPLRTVNPPPPQVLRACVIPPHDENRTECLDTVAERIHKATGRAAACHINGPIEIDPKHGALTADTIPEIKAPEELPAAPQAAPGRTCSPNAGRRASNIGIA